MKISNYTSAQAFSLLSSFTSLVGDSLPFLCQRDHQGRNSTMIQVVTHVFETVD